MSVPPVLDYERERLRIALSGMIEALTVEPVEAEYTIKGGEVQVSESKTGKKVDGENIFDEVEAVLFEGKREYEVPIMPAEPRLTTAEAEALNQTKLLGNYRINYRLTSDQSEERVENLRTASNAVSRNVLAPGEVFSFNELAAPLGYNETKVIVNSKEDYADNGGLY